MGNYGFKINEPFYIVSRMPMRRVASASGHNGIIRIQTVDVNRKNQWQQFFYDSVSKTIKCQARKDQSIQLAGNNLYLRNTNSRWM
jgi:hypothetical protein